MGEHSAGDAIVDETTRPATPRPGAASEGPLGHVVSVQVLLGVFGALLALTALTVAVSYVDFGALNLLVAIGVATVKASLVALYFMHLRYDSPFNAVVFLIGVAFLALFLAITMLDTIKYHPDVQTWQETAR